MKADVKTSLPTHEFIFDINQISLEDLKTLYTQFQIEDFGNAEEAKDKVTFFNCFIDKETNGNKEAFLLIRLAAILSSNSGKVITEEVQRNEKTYLYSYFAKNSHHKVDFDLADYKEIDDDFDDIQIVIDTFDVKSILPMMSKYNFLREISN